MRRMGNRRWLCSVAALALSSVGWSGCDGGLSTVLVGVTSLPPNTIRINAALSIGGKATTATFARDSNNRYVASSDMLRPRGRRLRRMPSWPLTCQRARPVPSSPGSPSRPPIRRPWDGGHTTHADGDAGRLWPCRSGRSDALPTWRSTCVPSPILVRFDRRRAGYKP